MEIMKPKNIIVYVAHVDDEIISCGGSILKLISMGHNIDIVYAGNGIIVHGRNGHDYRLHAEKIAKAFGVRAYYFLNVPTMEFDKYGQLELNKRFTNLNYHFDLIITHHHDDVNKDHRIVYESARVLCRYNDAGLLCCDSIGGLFNFNPNFFIDITNTIGEKHKIFEIIEPEIKEFPHERSHMALEAKAKYWGSKVGYKCAEAFECKKWVI